MYLFFYTLRIPGCTLVTTKTYPASNPVYPRLYMSLLNTYYSLRYAARN